METGRYIRNGFVEAGHAARLSVNGAEGLDLALNEHWDAFILDRMLPGDIDGLAGLRQLGKTTPVLILSALSSLEVSPVSKSLQGRFDPLTHGHPNGGNAAETRRSGRPG
jgi:DNA-binding NtrC family response regulator